MKIFGSYNAAKFHYSDLRIENLKESELFLFGSQLIIKVCEHEDLEDWDCGCSFSCSMCHITKHCKDCESYFYSGDVYPVGFVDLEQTRLIKSGLSQMIRNLLKIKESRNG